MENSEKQTPSAFIVYHQAMIHINHLVMQLPKVKSYQYVELHHITSQLNNLVNIAAEREKEQIVKAFNEGTFAKDEKVTAEEYYKKTYE
jgi:hypothetical protein